MRRTSSSITVSFCGLLLAAGCGNPASTGNGSLTNPSIPGNCVQGSAACPAIGAAGTVAIGAAGVVSSPAGTAAPVTAGTPASAAGTVAMPSAGSAAPATNGGVPCDVATLVSTHCTLCHGAKPQGGAPMSLMTIGDFHAPAKSNPAMTVAAIAPSRINATDQARRMPPVNSTAALSDAEKATLTTWLSGGAQGVATACPIMEPAKPGADGGVDAGPATMGGMGGASLDPIEYNDPDMKCYKFLTHAPGDMNAPYSHGPGEEYVNFTFKAPWTGTVYTRAHKLSVGDAPILHHWLLYIDSTPGADGGVQGGSTGIHPSSNLLHAWAPGASPLYFDPDVGMKLDSSQGVTLEAHINNATGSTGTDHNGAEICVTTKVPAHVIDLTWTGSERLGSLMASGTCTPRKFPIHIIAAQPHMHKKGTHMKVVINRAGGMTEVMHDADFSFDNQRYYLSDKVLMQGDTFTVTCTYSSPASFGQSTNNEMCYWFPFAWPAGSMASGAGIHGPTTCLN
jgi:hypothetical protein